MAWVLLGLGCAVMYAVAMIWLLGRAFRATARRNELLEPERRRAELLVSSVRRAP